MSDSTADTNIPITRLPFGAELPPKVPYSTTDNVGVGDEANENLPVQVNNRQIVPVGTSSNPIRSVHLKRKSSGKTVNDVPTSDTPNADDPGTMIATKEYVDGSRITINGKIRYRSTITRKNMYSRASILINSSTGDGKKLSDVAVVDSNTKYGIYTVQTDCVLGIWCGGNCGSITGELAHVWMLCNVPNSSGTMTNTWVIVNQFVETLGGFDDNRQIFIPVCAGTKFRFAFGKQTYNIKSGNNAITIADGSKKPGEYLTVAANVTAGSEDDPGKIIFTEFEVTTIAGNGSSGGDDSEEGGDDGGTVDPTSNVPLKILEVNTKMTGANAANTSSYCTYSTSKFMFNVPKDNAQTLLVDFCSELPGGTMSLKIKAVTSYNGTTPVESEMVIAYSQQLPNNVSGFQLTLPVNSFECSGDNLVMIIEGADNVHHAHITLLRG